MVESKLTYEECRRQRLEENKKRMEELNLNKLADALKSPSPKPSPAKQLKRHRDISSLSVRRSSRVADKPPPNYKEVPIEPFSGIRRSYQRRDLLNRVYASHEERIYAIDRATEVQASLDSSYPSFVKPMLQSHVTGGFWLGLPNHFCKKNLPHHDEMVTLVDEDGDEFPTKYLADKTGLSGGWRGFSLDHQLVDGDALVFHLTKPTEFQVYIIRAYNLEDKADTDNSDKNSDVSQLENSGKRTRSTKRESENRKKVEDKADTDNSNKNSDVSQLENSGKRTRSTKRESDNRKKVEDKADTDNSNKNSDVSQLEKSGKRTRSSARKK